MAAAVPAQREWERIAVDVRAACLERAADRIEADRARFMALAIREAGKSLTAAVAEVRGGGGPAALLRRPSPRTVASVAVTAARTDRRDR